MKQLVALLLLNIFISCSEAASNQLDNTSNPMTVPVDNQTKLSNQVSNSDDLKSNVTQKVQQESPQNTELKNDTVNKTSLVSTQEKQEVDNTNTNFHDYVNYNTFLSQHVSQSGKVNYNSIKSNIDNLDKIINEFQRNSPVSDWTKNQKLAYWINAYNVFTIKLVASNYPVSSIKDITAKPWDKVFIEIGDQKMSLNDIEHKEIRAKYNEPRIHFALNCASESCPKLLNKAYKAVSLNSQLTQATKSFLNDNTKNDLSDINSIKVSQLFDWYKTDFDKDGDIVVFINKYYSTTFVDPKISYLDYSWKLNN